MNQRFLFPLPEAGAGGEGGEGETDATLKRASWVVINTSAGKDSQTMMRAVVRRCDSLGVARSRLVAVHADLGKVEWAGVRELAGEQAAAYGLRFEVVRYRDRSREELTLLDYARRRKKWPGQRTRWCTSDFKRGPVGRLITSLVEEAGWGKGNRRRRPEARCVVVNCLGMRADESSSRAKLSPWSLNGDASNGKRTVYDWLPIFRLSKAEVWEDVRSSGVPHHPAYGLGMPRLSCCFCIFAPFPALVLAGRHNPGLLREYVEVEREIGHSFRQTFSMADVLRAVEEGGGAAETAEVRDWEM